MTSIRPARADDMPAVADLWHAGWHDAHAGHVPEGLTAGRTLAAFHQRTPLRVADTRVAVAEDDVVRGFSMVVGDEVEQLFVDQAARGTGLAQDLLADAERRVADGGHSIAWLAVVTGNARARRFYEKCEWTDAGDLPYEVTAGGERFISPCRRYVKRIAPGEERWAEHFPRLFAPAYVDYANARIVYQADAAPRDAVTRLHLIALTEDAEVVVCRSAQGWRFLPGGTREPGESLHELAERELLEEAGATLVGDVVQFAAHCATSERAEPYRPHFPHPVTYWAYALAHVRVTGPPLNPPDGEEVVEVQAIAPTDAADYLEVADPMHADVLRHAHALGLIR